jgi:hypothetical protein
MFLPFKVKEKCPSLSFCHGDGLRMPEARVRRVTRTLGRRPRLATGTCKLLLFVKLKLYDRARSQALDSFPVRPGLRALGLGRPNGTMMMAQEQAARCGGGGTAVSLDDDDGDTELGAMGYRGDWQ